MSCYVTLRTRITDVALLEECLGELQYTVTHRSHADRRGDLVMSISGGAPDHSGRPAHFDVVASTGQEVELHGDNQILDAERVNAIHRVYAERLVLREAEQRGFTGVERRVVNGEVVLTLRKWVA